MTDKLTVPDVLPFVQTYLAKAGNIVGGNLHIVLDDGNIHDDHIRFCRDECIKYGDTDGLQLCDLLLRLSRTQRLKIVRNT